MANPYQSPGNPIPLVIHDWSQLHVLQRLLCNTTITHKQGSLTGLEWKGLLDWIDFVRAFGMEKYFPGRLSVQDARTMHMRTTDVQTPTKEDLPWKVLQQIMFMSSQCREDVINNFTETVTPREVKKKPMFRRSKVPKAQATERIPHPMDMILLLFSCSDYMLRQVLAHKLFMCRLAIPFILLTATDTVEMMLWPLRSIILEWRNSKEAKEEALVKCKLNMIAFVRYGETEFSKSSLMNDVLSSQSHPTFFHKESPCGNQKRLISNGTVELSHFLPGGSQRDIFNDPALFFNLRGDACDHPVQHSVLVDLATMLVIIVDIGELHKDTVQVMLKATTKEKQQRVSIVLTDSKRHNEKDIEELWKLFNETVSGTIADEDMVTTFDEKGGQHNLRNVIEEVRDVISEKLLTEPVVSLDQYALSHLKAKCEVDEVANSHCSAGKRVANTVLTELKKVDCLQRKKVLLPKQGPCLTEIGKLLRMLHRTFAHDTEAEASHRTMDQISKREELILEMNRMRMEQANANETESFMDRVIELFQEQKETSEFAIRYLQLKLDAISRSLLPDLQRTKHEHWLKLTKTQGDENAESVKRLRDKIEELEENIAAATLGWEHLIRELGQLYEVSSALQNSRENVSSLPTLVGRQLLRGHSVELMDGDHGILPLTWIKAVFQALSQQVGETKKILVLSVVGVQSSGKSTLLNTLFGLEFAVSAGRCTRGVYAQLLPVNEKNNLPVDYILVLDSEGLRSQQRERNYQYDNELATLVLGLSDLALVNVKGENVSEMTDVLEIVVHSLLRMKVADSHHKRRCVMLHQNVTAINAREKLTDDRQRLEERLNQMTKQACLAESLTDSSISFNQIIQFDCKHDVLYFPDLLTGEAPMATINQGYSNRAAKTQQRILKDIRTRCRNCIAIPDFITRVADMWEGVLSDDFIFSFKNTLAAKAYVEVEREFADQTFKLEHELLDWMNKVCKVEIGNCRSVDNLGKGCEELRLTLNKKVETLVAPKVKRLHYFFENHSERDIVVNWKEEKATSLTIYGQTLARQTELDLINMKDRKLFELQQKHDSKAHEKKIVEEAIALAEDIRGKHLTEEELQTEFDTLWEKCTDRLPVKTSQTQEQVMCALQNVLQNKFRSEGWVRYLRPQLERTPLKACDQLRKITEQDIAEEYIVLKESESYWDEFKKTVGRDPSWKDYVEEASNKANDILDTVMSRVAMICSQDTQFKRIHGREIVDLLWEEIAMHNKSPPDKAAFTITPQFKAMLAVRVTSCAISKFEQMNQHFEEQYGIEAQMKRYKDRVFRLFTNTVQEASAEVIASGDFCEALKNVIIEYVSHDVKHKIAESIKEHLRIKSDLIITILKEIADESNFVSFHSYATDPTMFAQKWFHQHCIKHMFIETNGKTKYREVAHCAMQTIVTLIDSSIKTATEEVSTVEETKQYDSWKENFCQNMSTAIPVNSNDLKMAKACKITNFAHFKTRLEEDLRKMEETVRYDILNATASDLFLKGVRNTVERIFPRLWGCHKQCPFCKEPCKMTDPYHSGSHRCVQHKPTGIVGVGSRKWVTSDKLRTETCNWYVASGKTFRCNDIGNQCRKTGKCKGLWKRLVGPITQHRYRDYYMYIPDWRIDPDPAGEACKYWKWAMCYFRGQLLQAYPNKRLNIPKSWEFITKQEAIDNLSDY